MNNVSLALLGGSEKPDPLCEFPRDFVAFFKVKVLYAIRKRNSTAMLQRRSEGGVSVANVQKNGNFLDY